MVKILIQLYFILQLFHGEFCIAQEHDENTEKTPKPEISQISLIQGQKYPLEGLIPDDYQLSSPGIIDITPSNFGLLLIAKQPGKTTLNLKIKDTRLQINIHVKGTSSTESLNWNEKIRSIPGIKIFSTDKKHIIQGEVLSRGHYQKLLWILKNHSTDLMMTAIAAPGIKLSLIEQAKSSLAYAGIGNKEIVNIGHRFFLEGSVYTIEELDQSIETVQAIIPNIENHIPIPIQADPTFQVRVYILEITKQAHETLGLSWPGTISNAIVATPAKLLINPSWTATLKQLASLGQAQILAEPMLTIRNGSSAELAAGGEIPIRITGKHENAIHWKHYGLKINLRIQKVSNRKIRTKIHTVSSELDSSASIDGIPGLRKNELNTEVDSPEGQPILLTGLFHSVQSKDVEKMPLLGSIPLLGELFKSRRFINHESELLIALLPSYGTQHISLPLHSFHGLEFDKKWRVTD